MPNRSKTHLATTTMARVRRVTRRALGLALLPVLLAPSACSRGGAPAAPPADALVRAGKALGLVMPADARVLFYHRLSETPVRGVPTPDDALHLKLEISHTALGAFLAQPPFATAAWSRDTRAVADRPEWPAWRPSRVSKFQSVNVEWPANHGLNVLIDTSGTNAVVYLEGFES